MAPKAVYYRYLITWLTTKFKVSVKDVTNNVQQHSNNYPYSGYKHCYLQLGNEHGYPLHEQCQSYVKQSYATQRER